MSTELKVLGLVVGLVFTACAEDEDPDFGGAGGTTGGANGGSGAGGADSGLTGGAPSGGAPSGGGVPSGGAPSGGEVPAGGAPSPNDAAVVGGVPAPQDAGPPVGGANDGGPPPFGGAEAGTGPSDAAGGMVSVDARDLQPVPFGGPCAADEECAEGFICRRVGMGGDVCTQECEADETCPEGSQGRKCNNMGLCRP
jgi:hypothetical protein